MQNFSRFFFKLSRYGSKGRVWLAAEGGWGVHTSFYIRTGHDTYFSNLIAFYFFILWFWKHDPFCEFIYMYVTNVYLFFRTWSILTVNPRPRMTPRVRGWNCREGRRRLDVVFNCLISSCNVSELFPFPSQDFLVLGYLYIYS